MPVSLASPPSPRKELMDLEPGIELKNKEQLTNQVSQHQVSKQNNPSLGITLGITFSLELK